MKIIAIESSCDETSIAFLQNKKVMDCLTWSQIDTHQKFGGVVPQLASKLHSNRLPIILQTMLKRSAIVWKEIDFIAYAAKPGLVGCLKMGEALAQSITTICNIPNLKINHLYAHIYAVSFSKKIQFPALGLVISGGHTQLYYIPEELIFKKIGETVDDAAGEALDKIGRKLKLPYPAGPEIEKLAKRGKWKYKLNIYQDKKNLNFSFSGLKTHAIHLIEKTGLENIQINDFAHSVQKTIFQNIWKKIATATKQYKVQNIIVGGGVAANNELRKELKKLEIPVLYPKKEYCTDNAAMIGVIAYHQVQKDKKLK